MVWGNIKNNLNHVFSCKHNKLIICCRQTHCMGCGGPELIRLPQHQPGAAIFRICKGQKREISLFSSPSRRLRGKIDSFSIRNWCFLFRDESSSLYSLQGLQNFQHLTLFTSLNRKGNRQTEVGLRAKSSHCSLASNGINLRKSPARKKSLRNWGPWKTALSGLFSLPLPRLAQWTVCFSSSLLPQCLCQSLGQNKLFWNVPYCGF